MSRPVDPWCLRETQLDLDDMDGAASLFALSNGYLGVRGGLEEGQPGSGPGTLLAAVYEERPLTYAERGYGYPEGSDQIAPVGDAWHVTLTVDGQQLDVRDGGLHEHERVLDLRAGLLHRRLRWTAPSGAEVEVRTQRLVSLRRRELLAVRYEVRALGDARVSLRPVAGCPHTPPPDVQPPEDWHSPPLAPDGCGHDPSGAWFAQRTGTTGIGVAVAVSHRAEASDGVAVSWADDDEGVEVGADLGAGQELRLEVLAAHVAAAGPSTAELRGRAEAALRPATAAGWRRLTDEQTDLLTEVWERADVVVEGDDEMQQAVRFAIFQVVQAAACAAGQGIRAKGLTGTGYHGHSFWDADTFVLPLLNHALPTAAADHLRWRHSTLPLARQRARALNLPGATLPWRTISGRECSGYWPAGTAAFHVNADVADAAVRHASTTCDEEFARDVALELVVCTARLWLGLGHHTADGSFRIDGVTGPDEYTALQDNNTYTNLMARRNLLAARDLAVRFPERARAMGVDDDECLRWVRAAEAVVVPTDPVTGVTEQSENFTRHAPWDFDRIGADGEPLMSRAPYVELYRRQVVKQADLVLALYLAGESFTTEQKRRDFDHYEPITVRDSSLSAPAQAVVAAEVGHLGLAWDYTRETALIDLHDLHASRADGLHLAALAGAWTALVAGFGGLRDGDGRLRFAPRLPPSVSRLRFRLRHGTAALEVEVVAGSATYQLSEGEALDAVHHGREIRLTAAEPLVRLPVPALEPLPRPAQPPGREPRAPWTKPGGRTS